MMRGETITITRQQSTGDHDPSGAPIVEQITETVDNVLVAPGTQDNLTDAGHPTGIDTALTLYFPRTWEYSSLRGALITVRGHQWKVEGDPMPIDGNITPTQWNLVVTVTDTRG